MTQSTPQPLPQKIREMHNHHMDSSIWNDLNIRDDDIVPNYAKSGSTWVQQIAAQMLFGPDPDIRLTSWSPGSICASRPKRSSCHR